MKLSKKSAYQPDVYDSESHNVRIPDQNQLQSAASNQPTTNNGNVAELPVVGSSFLNESGLIGHDLWRQLKTVTIFQCFRVKRELIRIGKQPL